MLIYLLQKNIYYISDENRLNNVLKCMGFVSISILVDIKKEKRWWHVCKNADCSLWSKFSSQKYKRNKKRNFLSLSKVIKIVCLLFLSCYIMFNNKSWMLQQINHFLFLYKRKVLSGMCLFWKISWTLY